MSRERFVDCLVIASIALSLASGCGHNDLVSCDAIDCGKHGHCDYIGPTPWCFCDEGWAGALLGSCNTPALVTGTTCTIHDFCHQFDSCFDDYYADQRYCSHQCETIADCPLDEDGVQMCCSKPIGTVYWCYRNFSGQPCE